MSGVTFLTYHAVGDGPSPLFVSVAELEGHAAAIAASGLPSLTVRDAARALRAGGPPARAVALTFDDAFAGVAEAALPLLARHGLVASVFAVAGRLGGTSDWRSQPATAPRLPLADAAALAALAAAGWEIGSHTTEHDPLRGGPAAIEDEARRSRMLLEDAVGVEVTSFAYPYGLVERGAEAALASAGFEAACTTRLAVARPSSDPFRLPRVDAHYVRRPETLRAVVEGRGGAYLAVRALGSRARRTVRPDHREPR